MSDASIVTGAMCAALTGLGGVLALRSAQQGSYLRATRWAGLALIPIGLYLTGLATLARRVGSALTDWATDLAFGVRAWAGVAVLAVAISMLLLVRAVNARRAGAAAEAPPSLPGASGRPLPSPTEPGAARPAKAKPAKQSRSRRGDSGLGGEFAEIEEILKRRGI
ncbi:hypothetical protein LO772_27975 [Yinghuangia sp. ASG 101]|uniref:hypothetical protein n=1 Tax=Yinghuangia sp. ASG 101 TaxID=2896848 RepID=UPI001E5826DB|nr:hypothetical protein [Yinghuangia sp. ASG 101]UGQ10639.1 hypothetical protein LO772_27975 [Yinghuangia sp. ASG 101]